MDKNHTATYLSIDKEFLEILNLQDHKVVSFTITSKLGEHIKVEAEFLLDNGQVGEIGKLLQTVQLKEED